MRFWAMPERAWDDTLLSKTAGDLFARRKAADRLLRIGQSAVDANFKDAATRPPEIHLRRGSQF
jgi:hypothetical protein